MVGGEYGICLVGRNRLLLACNFGVVELLSHAVAPEVGHPGEKVAEEEVQVHAEALATELGVEPTDKKTLVRFFFFIPLYYFHCFWGG